MKSISTVLSLLSLLTLISCGGGQKTSTSLEISKSFAVVNPNYGGGLIVTGLNLTTGQNFSQGLISNTSLRYNLDPGPWVFTAVGWDGGGAAGSEKVFAGTPYCGLVQQELSGTSATVTLNLSEATCATNAFAGNLPSGVAGKSLRKLKAVTSCNTFFDGALLPGDTVSSKIVTSASSISFCDSPTMAADLKTEVKSMRIHSMSKGPLQVLPDIGIMSPCIVQDTTNPSVIYTDATTPTNPYGTNYDLRLPLKNVPFIITLFKESNCTRPVARYDFNKGLLPIHASFDHLLLDNNGNNDEVKLILPGSDMKRGISPLAHLLPYFKKGDGSRFPTEAVVSQDFHAFGATTNEMIIDRASCGTFGTHSNVATTPVPTCTDLGEMIKVTYKPNTSPANGYIEIDSDQYSFYAEAAGAVRYESNRIIWNMFGPTDPTMGKERFYGDPLYDRDNSYGLLSEIRNMFSSRGAGGGLSGFDHSQTFQNACLNVVAEKELSIFNYEEAMFETYKVRIHNSFVSSPNAYLMDASSRDSNTPSAAFDKRMLIWDYKLDLVNPIMVMEFSCSELVGTFESSLVHPRGSETEHENLIISWNTNTSGTGFENQRFEMLQHKVTKNSAGEILKDVRNIARTDKLAGGSDYANWYYSFVSKYNGSIWTEQLEYFDQVTEGNTVCYARDVESSTYGTLNGIFGDAATPIATIRNRTPGTATAEKYTIDGSFPQTITLSGCATNTLPTFSSTNGGDKINGTLPFVLSSLGPSFENEFGGTFFTAP